MIVTVVKAAVDSFLSRNVSLRRPIVTVRTALSLKPMTVGRKAVELRHIPYSSAQTCPMAYSDVYTISTRDPARK
jgi:hypothetical protein